MWSNCNMWLIRRLLQNNVPANRKGEIASMSEIVGTVHCAAVHWVWLHYSCEKYLNCHEEKSKQLQKKKINCTYYKYNSNENWKNDIKWFITKIDMIQWHWSSVHLTTKLCAPSLYYQGINSSAEEVFWLLCQLFMHCLLNPLIWSEVTST